MTVVTKCSLLAITLWKCAERKKGWRKVVTKILHNIVMILLFFFLLILLRLTCLQL